MDKKISDIFGYGDEIAVDWGTGESCDPAEIKELTMKRIHDENITPTEYGRAVKKARPVWRTLLIAAVAAVLLAGTALAVYQYTLRDAAIEDVPTWESEHYEWKAGETETRLSLNGFYDSPEYQAYVEWTDWLRSWNEEHPDPWTELGVDDSYYETPANYLVYTAYLSEQGEVLDEIAAKYGLSLLSESSEIRSEAQLCRALGLESLLADEYEMEGGYFFDNGTFKVSGRTSVNGKSVDFTIWNAVKGSFIPLSDRLPEDYTEWSYTTTDGLEVILMTDTLRGHTTVIAPLSGCYVTASITTDDAQAAQAFADAMDLSALEALFATEGARAAAAQSIADYMESLSSATIVDEIGEDEQAVLDYLGDWYPAVLPEGVTLYAMSANAPDSFGDYYSVRREYNGLNGTASFFYRELDPLDGENEESRQTLAAYTETTGPSGEPHTPCTVNGYEAMLVEPNGAGAGDYVLCWLDTDRQLLFRISLYGSSEESLMAMAESVTGTAPENPPARNASTPEERFQQSLMPLSRVMISIGSSYGADQAMTKRMLAELGNFGLTELPEGADDLIAIGGGRDTMYEYYWDGPASWSSMYMAYSITPELGMDGLSLRYRRFDDGRTAEAFQVEKQYDDYYGDITDCKVGLYDGYIADVSGAKYVEWYDEDRDLIFEVSSESSLYGLADAELVALAESVTEQAWSTIFLSMSTETERVLEELGRYDLPGASYGSIVAALDEQVEDWQDAPLWFVEDGPYVSMSAAASYADGLMLSWQRTWADAERTVENGAESFAAMEKYLLACDETGAVQTGLSVNGHDALCVSYPYEMSWGEMHTDLIWYDEDAGLIFTLADYPDEDGTPRTAAQLIALAESVIAQ